MEGPRPWDRNPQIRYLHRYRFSEQFQSRECGTANKPALHNGIPRSGIG
jgi:hypothetical protein